MAGQMDGRVVDGSGPGGRRKGGHDGEDGCFWAVMAARRAVARQIPCAGAANTHAHDSA